jgi:hypothetical protein
LDEHFKKQSRLCTNDSHVAIVKAENYCKINLEEIKHTIQFTEKQNCIQTIFYNLSLANRLSLANLRRYIKIESKFTLGSNKCDAQRFARKILNNG